MRYNNIDITVLVRDRAITEYPHNGQTFIEGREGSAYEVKVTNHNNHRVEAVVSVDGLSVIDGKDAGPQSSGYLLDAGESVVIPGWKLNDAQVAAFEFAGKSGSYAAQSTGTARNTGVIGVMAFRERGPGGYHRTVANHGILYAGLPGSIHTGYLTGAQSGGYVDSTYTSFSGLADGGRSRGLGLMNINAQAMNCMAPTVDTLGASSSNAMIGSAMLNSFQQQSEAPSAMRSRAMSQAVSKGPAEAPAKVEQTLGTGFGKAQDFATQTVTFNRGDLHAMIVMYYDSGEGLKKRGIDLSRRAKSSKTQTPNAFPGMSQGCTPPAGWNG
jgi:hypothetical protein